MKYRNLTVIMIAACGLGCVKSSCVNEKLNLENTRKIQLQTIAFDDRSTNVIITNELSKPMSNLTLFDKGITGGEWKIDPPSTIEPGKQALMATTSNAWLKGAGGWVKYKVERNNTFLTFNWYNPYAGANSYSATTPNKNYIFNAKGGSGNNSSLYWTVRNNKPVRIYTAVIMADPQAWRLPEGDPNAESNRMPWIEVNKKVATSLRSLTPSFFILNGDMTEFGRKKTYADYEYVYGKLGAPVYEGLGNHDYANNVGNCTMPEELNFSANACAISAVERMNALIKNYAERLSFFSQDVTERLVIGGHQSASAIEGSLSYSWDYGDIHYVQLHNHPSYEVTITDNFTKVRITKSLKWLEKDLADADARGRVTIINFHDARPGYDDGDSHFINKNNYADLSFFKSIITSHKVKAIFVGHIHQQEYCRAKNDTVFGNIPVYSAGALFKGDYYLLDINKKSISVKAYNGKTGVPVLVKDLGVIGSGAKFSPSCSKL